MYLAPESGTVPLSTLPLGRAATIAGISANAGKRAEHLISIGFVTGESVIPVFSSPAGDPTAYLLGGCVRVALRRAEAKNIYVRVRSL